MPTPTLTLRLALAISLCALALPTIVHAGNNVVPNPGFEPMSCSNDAPPCGWHQDSGQLGVSSWQPHSGLFNLWLFAPGDYASAVSDCVPLGQGRYTASFWHRTIDNPNFGVWFVGFSARFYPKARCNGPESSSEIGAYPIGDGLWYEELGNFEAPAGTASARFGLHMDGWCDGACWGEGAEFDDLEVESMPSAIPLRPGAPRVQRNVSTGQ